MPSSGIQNILYNGVGRQYGLQGFKFLNSTYIYRHTFIMEENGLKRFNSAVMTRSVLQNGITKSVSRLETRINLKNIQAIKCISHNKNLLKRKMLILFFIKAISYWVIGA